MSFVLEALKKQEAGNDPDAAVSLARAGVLRRRHRLWMSVAAVAMAVNAALLLWMFAPLGQRTAPPPEAPADRAARDGAPASADAGTAAPAGPVATERTPPAAGARDVTGQAGEPEITGQATALARGPAPPADAPANPSAEASVMRSRTTDSGSSAMPAAESEAAEAAPAVDRPAGPATIALGDLPPDARSRFPGIAFSTHIYAEDPGLRAVFANGERHREGDRIRGLEILEITEGGVVLAFENYRVEVPVVVDWDSL